MSNRLTLLLSVLALSACGGAKRAAEKAVASADSAIATVAADAERVAPELLQPLHHAVTNAKASLAAASSGSRDRQGHRHSRSRHGGLGQGGAGEEGPGRGLRDAERGDAAKPGGGQAEAGEAAAITVPGATGGAARKPTTMP